MEKSQESNVEYKHEEKVSNYLTEFPRISEMPFFKRFEQLAYFSTKDFKEDGDGDEVIDSFSSSLSIKVPSVDRASQRTEGLWMSDENCFNCYDCGTKFTTLKRKHHCRLCGQIFCSNCSSKTIKSVSLGFNNAVRCCNLCYTEVKYFAAPQLKDNIAVVETDAGEVDLEVMETKSELTPMKTRRSQSVFEAVKESLMAMGKEEKHDFESPFSGLLSGSTLMFPKTISEDLSGTMEPLQATLEKLYDDHLNSLVFRLLFSAGLDENQHQYHPMLLRFALRASKSMKLNTRPLGTDELDIGKYFSVNLIPGGVLDQSAYVEGVIIQNNVCLRKMRNNIEHPRILCLSCPLQFERHQGLSSFDVVVTQEEEYLNILVSKIELLQPDLLVVQKSVSGRMKELLLQRNISCLANVGEGDMRKIARATCSTVLPSAEHVDFFPDRNIIGTCIRFHIMTIPQNTAEHRKRSTAFALFDGCDSSKFASVYFRHPDEEVLKSLRNVMNTCVHVAWNLRREFKFILASRISKSPDRLLQIPASPSLKNQNILSLSPLIPIPCQSHTNVSPNTVVSPIVHDQSSTMYAFEDSVAPKQETVILNDLVFTECLLTANNNRLCTTPSMRRVEFYADSDQTIYQYLSDFCFSEKWHCHSDCKQSLLHRHFIAYNHSNGRVIVRVRKIKQPGNATSEILTWKYCRKCSKIVSPLSSLSKDIMKFSFGKYLELFFYGDELEYVSTECTHLAFRDHEHFFSSGSFVVRFFYEYVEPFEVATSSYEEYSRSKDFVHGRINSIQTFLRDELKSFHVTSEYVLRGFQDTVKNILAQYEDGNELNSILESIPEKMQRMKAFTLDFEEESCLIKSEKIALLSCIESMNVYRVNFFWNELIKAIRRLHSALFSELSKSSISEFSRPLASSSSTIMQKYTTSSISDVETKTEFHPSPKLDSPRRASVSHSPSHIPTFSTIIQDIAKSSECSDPLFSTNWMLDEGLHVFPHPVIMNASMVVLEDDPSSIISYALSSLEHISTLHETSFAEFAALSVDEQTKLFGIIAPDEVLDISRGTQDGQLPDISIPQSTPETIRSGLLHSSFDPLKINFSSNAHGETNRFSCTIHFPIQFHALRSFYMDWDFDFITQLSRCAIWTAKGGKSGSGFSKTLDGNFILKYVQKKELKMYLNFAQQYFQYVETSLFRKCPSLLVKILGVFEVSWKKSGVKKMPTKYVVVMPNLFSDVDVSTVFDLKGSIRNRLAAEDENEDSKTDVVLLDENFLRFTQGMPIPLSPKAKEFLRISVHNDTLFLSNQNIVDYSMLVGIDLDNSTLVLGIIDYLRQYTWDKQLETGVKSLARIAGQAEPTVVSPNNYKTRLRTALDRYFIASPDRFTSIYYPSTSTNHKSI